MIQAAPQGSPITLNFVLKTPDGVLVDPTSLAVTIANPNGDVVVAVGSPSWIRIGLWAYTFSIPFDAEVGIWTATWSGHTTDVVFETDDLFEVVYQGAPFASESASIPKAARGQRVALDAVFRAGAERVNVSDLEVSIVDPDGEAVPTGDSPNHLATGLYRLWWVVPYNVPNGIHVVTWSALVEGEQRSYEDVIEVIDQEPAVGLSSTGVDRVTVGELTSFDATFRSAALTLWDPESPRLVASDPSGTVIFDGRPERLAVGTYREIFSLGVPGYWTFDWSASENDILVSSAVIVQATLVGDGGPSSTEWHTYGATLAGVRALLPHLDIDHDTRPTVQQVERFIDNIASEVSLRVGLFSSVIADSELVDRITGMARMVVELGAAATAEDAAYPTRSSPNDTSYGSVLWERYQAALLALVEVVNNATSGDDPGAGSPGGSGAVTSPPPQFYTWMPT